MDQQQNERIDRIEPSPSGTRLSLVSLVFIAAGIVISIAKAILWAGGLLNGEVFGYAMAAVAVPALIAYAIAGRKAKRNWNRFAQWYLAICFVFYLLERMQRNARQ